MSPAASRPGLPVKLLLPITRCAGGELVLVIPKHLAWSGRGRLRARVGSRCQSRHAIKLVH
jgi:hypothetical protein